MHLVVHIVRSDTAMGYIDNIPLVCYSMNNFVWGLQDTFCFKVSIYIFKNYILHCEDKNVILGKLANVGTFVFHFFKRPILF